MTRNSVLFFLLVSQFLVLCSCYTTKCPENYFTVGNMLNCNPLLNCNDCRQIKFLKLIGFGAVKFVFLAEWKNISVSVSVLRNYEYHEDFHEGLRILKSLPHSPFIVQLIGYCEQANIIVTEYHPINNANNLKYVFENNEKSVQLSINMCLNYVKILNFIHNSPIGVRVNCDSNSLLKLLSQFLITVDGTLILNDVDALPEMKPNVSIRCGQNDASRSVSFFVPELYNKENPAYYRGYTDKTDVWKVPDVCDYILSLTPVNGFLYTLFNIHRRCKDENPDMRPTAKELVDFYQNAINHV